MNHSAGITTGRRNLLFWVMSNNPAEQEAIGLCIATEALDDIVNHSLLVMRDVSAYAGEAELVFFSSAHRDLFLVRLLDFAKESGAKQLTGVEGSLLAVLKAATHAPSFDRAGSVFELIQAVDSLENWLNATSTVDLWLPTLNMRAKLTMSRLDLITISGNHSKHNLSRLTGVTKIISSRLKTHGYAFDELMLPLALDDFREHLTENYFVYYSTWLAELLNNLRWGIQTYLQPIYATSYQREDDFRYRYDYPASVVNEVARQWFWRLMNHVRRLPNLKRFKGARGLKNESSLEWNQDTA